MVESPGAATPTAGAARYDGFADWYDAFNAPNAQVNQELIAHLMGPGQGMCLDLGCGTGLYFDAVRATGRTPVGVDFSADQLRLARGRGVCLQADAATLPFADQVFPAVQLMWISTDVNDFAAVVREAARVLQPGGVMVFCGVHPCFMGPHIEYREDGGRILHPTYRLADWHEEKPWWTGGAGLRNRVGMRHVPLPDLLHAFLDAGLTIEKVVEPEPALAIPVALALRLVRAG